MKKISEMEAGMMKHWWNGGGIDEKNIAEWKREFLYNL